MSDEYARTQRLGSALVKAMGAYYHSIFKVNAQLSDDGDDDVLPGCVPELRRLGFKGSFPDLYRESSGFISVINFQFYSAGGSFCVNLSYTDSGR
jgi:Domain of unknown function (DUF4304)